MPREDKNKSESDIMICEKCSGSGILSDGKSCDRCNGKGVFLSIRGKADFYWGGKISGTPLFLQYFGDLVEYLVRMLFSLFVVFTLIYGIYFIIIQNPYFWSTVSMRGKEVISDDNIAGAWFMFMFQFILDIISSFKIIFLEKGLGPLAFWSGLGGSVYLYYLMVSRQVSQKDIDFSSDDFRVFSGSEDRYSVDISCYSSYASLRVIRNTLNLSYDIGQSPSVFHMAKILLSYEEIRRLMIRVEIDIDDFTKYLDEKIGYLDKKNSGVGKFFIERPLNSEMKKILLFSFQESLVAGFSRIEIESLFLTLFRNEDINDYLRNFKVEPKDIRTAVLWSKSWGDIKIRRDRPRKMKHIVMNKAWTARVTPELDRFSYDLTDRARYGLNGFVVNRKKELDNLMRILERGSQNNALLIGEEGSGRTSIVKALANRMIHDEVFSSLQDKRLVVLDIGALVSGARAGGDLELRVREILEDMAQSGNIILYIPDIHNIAAAGSGEGFDISKVLSPILSQNIFQVIGSTDYLNYHKYIESRSDFANNFDIVKVEELSDEDTLKVVAINAGIIENREGIVMTYGAIKKSVELSKRYITNKLLPGKAIDLLAESAVEAARRGDDKVLRDDDIMSVITEKTGIPLVNISENEAEKLLHLEESLHERVIGQDDAIKAVSSAIRRVRVGMKMQNRPIGTFLFLGPTGVGKTELAKALAEIYYGDESSMVRIDMSEYQTINSVEKLIGYSSETAEGSMGGVLTEAIKKQPFSLILLDELEKANRNVLNLFLQVFDDGRLTDSLGRTVDFTNTIIIATSNAGSKVTNKIFTEGGSSNERVMEMVTPYLLEYFSPEFMNRFTEKIVFKSLTKDNLLDIAKLQISKLMLTLDKAQGINIEVSEDALSYLLEIGYSADYGARFMQRTIQEKLENLIAVEFLKGNIKRGDSFRITLKDLKET